jgi:hypothetical protein
MDDLLAGLAPKALANDGPMTRLFRDVGVDDFSGAARYLLNLPYGRITERSRFWLVLTEGRGTCSTKHALLAELAREQSIDVQLILGIYEMNERNTPGVGQVLSKYGMDVIPEAHCYLRSDGGRIDVTGVAAGAEPIERFVHEEPITVEQIGEYKNRVHREFLKEWASGKEELNRFSSDDLWRIREECIAALGAGVPVGDA